jgi:endo-1,4-beta-xylanase
VQIGGDTYQLYEATRVNAPSIDGTQTFQQYWAIRDSQRTSGTVNMQEVFDAWQAAGMSLGSHYYQIVATEAYNSKGTSSVQVQTPA